MHRDDGASNWQNYELRKDLWVIWNFLFRGNPLSSGEYIQVVHEKNILLSEKVFITFHNCMLPFNKSKQYLYCSCGRLSFWFSLPMDGLHVCVSLMLSDFWLGGALFPSVFSLASTVI